MDHMSAAERLTSIFGRWPSFHDAEVTRLVLDRSGLDGPTLDAEIHVFERADEVDSSGLYVLRHHTVAALRFHGVDALELSGFNRQNVLSDLVIHRMDPEMHEGLSLGVEMGGCFGVSASFQCRWCEVLSAEPWNATS